MTGLLVSQQKVLNDLRDVIGNKDKKLINKIENDYKTLIKKIWRRLDAISCVIDEYGNQLNAQLSHTNKLQKMIIPQTEEKIVKLKSERYALYEYIHKHNMVNIPFNIKNLQKELGLDLIYDEENTNIEQNPSIIDENVINKLESENHRLTQNLNKLKNWKKKLSKQLVGDKQLFGDKDTELNELKKQLKIANGKASIFKTKLEQINKWRKQGRVKIISSSPRNKENDSSQQSQDIKQSEDTKQSTNTINVENNEKEIKIKNKISSLENKIKESGEMYFCLQNSYNKMALKNEDLLKEIKKLEKNIEKKDKINDDLMVKYKEIDQKWKKRIMELQQNKELSEIALNKFKRKSECLKVEIDQITQDLNEKNEKLRKQHNERKQYNETVDDLENKSKDLKAKLEKYKIENENLNINISSSQREKESLQKEIDVWKLKYDKLQSETEKLTKNDEMNKLNINRLKMKLEILEQELKRESDDLQVEKKELQRDKELLQQQIDKLQSETQKLTKNDEKKKININRLMMKIEILENDKIECQHQIVQLKKELNNLQVEKESNISSLQRDKELLQQKIYKLESEKENINRLKMKIEILENDKTEFENKFVKLKKESDDLKVEKEELRETIGNNELEAQLQAEMLRVSVDDAKSELIKYNEQIEKLQKESNQKDCELQTKSQQLENKIKQVNQEKEEIIQQLNNELNNLKISYDEKKNDLTKLCNVDKSCDFLLDFINHPSLDLNLITKSLNKTTMKYDPSINDKRVNVIEMNISSMSLITHIALQVVSKNTMKRTETNVSIKLFYKLPSFYKNENWIEYGAKNERIVSVQSVSLRKLRLYPFFTKAIKLEIICPKRFSENNSIQLAISILGKQL